MLENTNWPLDLNNIIVFLLLSFASSQQRIPTIYSSMIYPSFHPVITNSAYLTDLRRTDSTARIISCIFDNIISLASYDDDHSRRKRKIYRNSLLLLLYTPQRHHHHHYESLLPFLYPEYTAITLMHISPCITMNVRHQTYDDLVLMDSSCSWIGDVHEWSRHFSFTEITTWGLFKTSGIKKSVLFSWCVYRIMVLSTIRLEITGRFGISSICCIRT